MRRLALILALLLPTLALAQPMPTPIIQFDSIDQSFAQIGPADPNLAVGPNHVVVATNRSYAVYNKSGTLIYGPFNLVPVYASLGATHPCDTSILAFDPEIIYDVRDDRWVFTAMTPNGHSPQYICIAVSRTNDPTGTWYAYATIVPGSGADAPKFSVWSDGYLYGATNDGAIAAYDLPAMVVGGTPRAAVWHQITGLGTLGTTGSGLFEPVTFDGYAPQPDQPALYAAVHVSNDDAVAGPSSIYLYQFTPNWTTPSSSTFVAAPGSPVVVPTFLWPGPLTSITSLKNFRPTYRVTYRNFATYHSMLLTWTTAVALAGGIDRPRVTELRQTGTGPWTITQSLNVITDAGDTVYRWNQSVAQDVFGNFGLVYNCGADVCISARKVTASANTWSQTDELLKSNGFGTSCISGTNRWGDYAAIQVDPTDQCTFWAINMYCKTSGGWGTWVAAFRMPGCTGAAVANPVDACTSGVCPQQCQAASQGLCPVGWPTIANNGICATLATCP